MKIITDSNIFKVFEGENLDYYFPEKHENMSLLDLLTNPSSTPRKLSNSFYN